LSPSITSTLAFQICVTLSPITRSTRNEKYKGEGRRRTKLNYPKLQHRKKTPKTNLKTPQKLLPGSGKSQGIYRQNWAQGICTEPSIKSWHAGPQGSHGNAAMAAFSRP